MKINKSLEVWSADRFSDEDEDVKEFKASGGTKLSLFCKKITLKLAEELANVLMKDEKLTALHLSYNNIGHKGAAAITQSLATHCTLREIYFSGNKFGQMGALSISQMLNTSSIQVLNLYNNKIGDDGAEAISIALATNQYIEILSLSYNNIGDHGAKKLAESLLKNSSIKELHVTKNKIGPEGAASLAASLKKNTAVTKVELSKNKILNEGAEKIAQLLADDNCTIEEIHISANNIGDEGAKELATAISTNETVEILNLSDNNIGDVGANAMASSLACNQKVIMMNLNCNAVGDKGAEDMSDCIKVNRTLKALYLSQNRIGDIGAISLSQAILPVNNDTLEELRISSNEITITGAVAINNALESNFTLLECDISNNIDVLADTIGQMENHLNRNCCIHTHLTSLNSIGIEFYITTDNETGELQWTRIQIENEEEDEEYEEENYNFDEERDESDEGIPLEDVLGSNLRGIYQDKRQRVLSDADLSSLSVSTKAKHVQQITNIYEAVTTGDGSLIDNFFSLLETIISRENVDMDNNSNNKLLYEKLLDTEKRNKLFKQKIYDTYILHATAEAEAVSTLMHCQFMVHKCGLDLDGLKDVKGRSVRAILMDAPNKEKQKWAETFNRPVDNVETIGATSFSTVDSDNPFDRYQVGDTVQYKTPNYSVFEAIDTHIFDAIDEIEAEKKVILKFMVDVKTFHIEFKNHSGQIFDECVLNEDLGLLNQKFSEEYTLKLLRVHKVRSIDLRDDIRKHLGTSLSDHDTEVLVLVYPFSDRTLGDVIIKTQVAGCQPNVVKNILFDIASSICHVHQRGMVHCDLKKDNIVQVGGRMKLTGFHAMVHNNDDFTTKYSSSICPPERALMLFPPSESSSESLENLQLQLQLVNECIDDKHIDVETRKELRKKRNKLEINIDISKRRDSLDGKKELKANVTHDVWSFGCIMYEMVTGSPLFLSDPNGNLVNESFQEVLNWTGLSNEQYLNIYKDKPNVSTLEKMTAKHLLDKCLKVNPSERYSSMFEILSDDFFVGHRSVEQPELNESFENLIENSPLKIPTEARRSFWKLTSWPSISLRDMS